MDTLGTVFWTLYRGGLRGCFVHKLFIWDLYIPGCLGFHCIYIVELLCNGRINLVWPLYGGGLIIYFVTALDVHNTFILTQSHLKVKV